MNLWIIGSTSQYSKAVAKQFLEAGHTVELMGRANLQYGATPGSQLESRETPDFVFININVEDTAYKPNNTRQYTKHLDWDKLSDVLDFKIQLLEYLCERNSNCTVCEVTSSITHWPYHHPDILPYSIMRSMSQTISHAFSTRLNVFAVCPNGITDESVYDYARLTHNLMNRGTDGFGIYNLADGGSLL